MLNKMITAFYSDSMLYHPVILLTGPRQVGKTTMLHKLMEDENIAREYVSLDDMVERMMAKTDAWGTGILGRACCPAANASAFTAGNSG